MHQWLLDVFDVFTERRSYPGYEQDPRLDPTNIPGWAYTRALAFRMVEDASKTRVDLFNLDLNVKDLKSLKGSLEKYNRVGRCCS